MLFSKFAKVGLVGAAVFGSVVNSNAQLPEVEKVLTKASGKMQDFAAEASAMQQRVAEKQKASREALAAQKEKYEKELDQQTAGNQAVEADIDKKHQEITELENANSVLKADTEHLQKENLAMHDVLVVVLEKVKAAKMFLADSMNVTDDSKAEELAVLEEPAPKPTLEHFLEVAKSEPAASFLQINAQKRQTPSEGPEDLVQVLTGSLNEIAEAEKEGEAELKAHFLSAWSAGNATYEELKNTDNSLNATIVQLRKLNADLSVAKEHLITTRTQLQQRLHGLRIFARKVDAASYQALKSIEVASGDSAPAAVKMEAKSAAPPSKAPEKKEEPKKEAPKKDTTDAKKEDAKAKVALLSGKGQALHGAAAAKKITVAAAAKAAPQQAAAQQPKPAAKKMALLGKDATSPDQAKTATKMEENKRSWFASFR